MRKLLLAFFVFGSLTTWAQNEKVDLGELHGNFQFDGQLYVRDSILDPNKDAFAREKSGVPNRPVAYELVKKSKGKIKK